MQLLLAYCTLPALRVERVSGCVGGCVKRFFTGLGYTGNQCPY
jgi:hypothetical protein